MRNTISRTVVALALLVAVTLPPRAAHAGPVWMKVPVDFTSVKTASTTKTFTLFTTNNVQMIERVVMRRDTVFSGGAIATETVSVGRSGSIARYQAATDIFTGALTGDTNDVITEAPGVEVSGTAIIATFTSTVANQSALTAGHLTFYFLVSNVPPGN